MPISLKKNTVSVMYNMITKIMHSDRSDTPKHISNWHFHSPQETGSWKADEQGALLQEVVQIRNSGHTFLAGWVIQIHIHSSICWKYHLQSYLLIQDHYIEVFYDITHVNVEEIYDILMLSLTVPFFACTSNVDSQQRLQSSVIRLLDGRKPFVAISECNCLHRIEYTHK